LGNGGKAYIIICNRLLQFSWWIPSQRLELSLLFKGTTPSLDRLRYNTLLNKYCILIIGLCMWHVSKIPDDFYESAFCYIWRIELLSQHRFHGISPYGNYRSCSCSGLLRFIHKQSSPSSSTMNLQSAISYLWCIMPGKRDIKYFFFFQS
jgi:hypothetical protein